MNNKSVSRRHEFGWRSLASIMMMLSVLFVMGWTSQASAQDYTLGMYGSDYGACYPVVTFSDGTDYHDANGNLVADTSQTPVNLSNCGTSYGYTWAENYGALGCYFNDAATSTPMIAQGTQDPVNCTQFAYGQDGVTCYPQDVNGNAMVDQSPVDPGLCPNLTPPGPPPQDPNVQIQMTSVNDTVYASQPIEMHVLPGQVIRLSADLFDVDQNYQAEGESADNFVWSASTPANGVADVCDPQASTACFFTSNFQSTDYGVSYYLPYNMGPSITITVASHDPRAENSDGSAMYAQITLWNDAYVPAWVPRVIIDADDYGRYYDHLDPYWALTGHGHWIYIEGTAYFVPAAYSLEDGSPWQPYRHGYWSWDLDSGWTWVSYDPWGWFTDHYGVWRYHGVYGWVWLPFDDRHYEAHTVTWYYDGVYVGWYPYSERHHDLYRHGFNEGFRDGYEEGILSLRHSRDDNYNGGYSMARREHITETNIYGETILHRRSDVTVVTINVVNNYNSGHYEVLSHVPGVDTHKDPNMSGRQGSAHTFVDPNGKAPQINTVKGHGGISTPRPQQGQKLPEKPAVYSALTKASSDNLQKGTRVSVGTTVTASAAHPEQAPKVVEPTTNGKGLVAAPHYTDKSGKRVELQPTSAKPAQPNKANPVAGAQPVHQPLPPGQAAAVKPPAFAKGQPPAPPVIANPNPGKKAPPAPAPKPIPVVKPPVRPAPVQKPMVKGACGKAQGTTTATAPVGAIACSAGNPSTAVAAGNSWSWKCFGANGGSDATCSANKPAPPKPVDANCGSDDGKTSTAEPQKNLCSVGKATAVVPNSSGWTWSCLGSNGGKNKTCASRKAGAPPPPKVPGVCGSDNGKTKTSMPVGQGLCQKGPMINLVTTATGWTWTCAGAEGGADAHCSANKQVVVKPKDGVCGAAKGMPTEKAPVGAALCSEGAASAVSLVGNNFQWSCAGSSGGKTVSCSAPKKVTPPPPPPRKDGVCGAAKGMPTESAPSGAALCSEGTASRVNLSGNTFEWSCSGSNGGSTASCSAPKKVAPPPPPPPPRKIDGVCGPTKNTCSAGAASGLIGSPTAGWKWKCEGSNGGSTASCSSKK